MTDHDLLRETFELARQARANFNHPFGAILVYAGQVVFRMSDNSVQCSDPTLHPELALISTACRSSGRMHLAGMELFSSTEPCPMCAGAIRAARISRVVYSVPRQRLAQLVAAGRHTSLAGHVTSKDIILDGEPRAEVVGPILPNEGEMVFSEYTFPSKEELAKLYRQSVIPSGDR